MWNVQGANKELLKKFKAKGKSYTEKTINKYNQLLGHVPPRAQCHSQGLRNTTDDSGYLNFTVPGAQLHRPSFLLENTNQASTSPLITKTSRKFTAYAKPVVYDGLTEHRDLHIHTAIHITGN